jgi:hypothetical protein
LHSWSFKTASLKFSISLWNAELEDSSPIITLSLSNAEDCSPASALRLAGGAVMAVQIVQRTTMQVNIEHSRPAGVRVLGRFDCQIQVDGAQPDSPATQSPSARSPAARGAPPARSPASRGAPRPPAPRRWPGGNLEARRWPRRSRSHWQLVCTLKSMPAGASEAGRADPGPPAALAVTVVAGGRVTVTDGHLEPWYPMISYDTSRYSS